MSHMPVASPPILLRNLRIINVRDYGAVGDGVTDDTEAIQSALDAAEDVGGNKGAVVYFPQSSEPYMFSNLTLPAYTTLQGSHMSQCVLKRLLGSAGTAVREKTVAEGNAQGASGIWIRDLHIHGNGTTGDGLDIGAQTPSIEFNFCAGLQNIHVREFTSGIGIKITGNAIACSYIWSNGNETGIKVLGGGNTIYAAWAEGNSLYDIHDAGDGNSFIGIQTEPATTAEPSILAAGFNGLYSSVYIGLGGNKSSLIKNVTGSDRNVFRDVRVLPNGHTFTNLIENETYPLASTGADVTNVDEYVVGQATVYARWYVDQTTGAYTKRVGNTEIVKGILQVEGQLRAEGTNAVQVESPVQLQGIIEAWVPAGTVGADVTAKIGNEGVSGLGLGLAGYTDGAGGAYVMHNAKAEYAAAAPATTKWLITHASFGSRLIRLDSTDGIGFYADAVATTAGNSFTPTLRLQVGNDGRLTAYKSLCLPSEIAPAQLTGNQDNYNPTGFSTARVVVLTSDASRDITGFVPAGDGHEVWIFNNGAQNIVLKHEVTSTAENRIIGVGGADTTLTPKTGARLYYSPSVDRWLILGHTL